MLDRLVPQKLNVAFGLHHASARAALSTRMERGPACAKQCTCVAVVGLVVCAAPHEHDRAVEVREWVSFPPAGTTAGEPGNPLPASTQWEIVAETAEWMEPIYQELIHQTAQGEVLHNDDTTMKILALMGEGRPRQPSAAEELQEKSERTGIFTSGIVSTRAGQKIALFFTGRKHAGENLATVLAQRAKELGPPIPMCDALSRNLPKEFQIVVANCIAHGRRKFVEVAAKFPEDCCYVLETLGAVYQHEAFCRDQGCRRRNVSATTKVIAVRG